MATAQSGWRRPEEGVATQQSSASVGSFGGVGAGVQRLGVEGDGVGTTRPVGLCGFMPTPGARRRQVPLHEANRGAARVDRANDKWAHRASVFPMK
jgi:hypothetical protein